jgi:hypothetical protein
VADDDATPTEFTDVVNMTASELERWMDTEEPKEVGQKSGSDESTGARKRTPDHRGLRTKKDDLGKDDYAHVRKVVGYAKRHLAQKPFGDVEHSKWRYSLMNWGHDPTKS